MKTVKKYFNNAFSANLDKGLLENEGIRAEVLHQNMPYMGISEKLAVELIVNDEDFDRAKKILEEAENNMMSIDESDVPEEESYTAFSKKACRLEEFCVEIRSEFFSYGLFQELIDFHAILLSFQEGCGAEVFAAEHQASAAG